jgi:hypothetical protein
VPPGGKTGKVTATVQLPGLAHDSAETVAIRWLCRALAANRACGGPKVPPWLSATNGWLPFRPSV